MKTLFTSLLCFLLSAKMFAHYEHLTLEQLYAYSDVVMIASVANQKSIRYPAGIKTEVTFNIQTILSQRSNTKIEGTTLTTSFAGGSIGNVSFSVCGQPHFQNAKTYLLFLYVDKNYMSCIVGGNQGLFEIINHNANSYLVNSSNERVSFYKDIVIHNDAEFITPKGPIPISKSNLSASKTKNVKIPELSMDRNLERLKQLSQTIPYLNNIVEESDEVTFVTDHDTIKKQVSNMVTYESKGQPDILSIPKSGILGACGVHVNKPYVFEVNSVLGQAQTEFNNVLAYWNFYMPILLTTNGDNTFQGGNGVSEFAGWQTNSTLNTQYGFNWGPSTIAVCFTYSVGDINSCHDISESDIAFNPAYVAYFGTSDLPSPPGEIKFTSVAMHEVGHSWGYQIGMYTETYDYGLPSVMHSFYPNLFENNINVHSIDAYLVREHYDNWISEPSIVDVGVESYYANNGLNPSYLMSNFLNAGDIFTAYAITVENMSNSDISNVTVDFTLINTTNFSSFNAGSYFFANFIGEANSTYDYQLTVPNNICTGTYALIVNVTIPPSYTEIPTGFYNNYTRVIGDIYITGANNPIAFTSSNPTGPAPWMINYSLDNSLLSIASVLWNFPGGIPSSSTNFNETVQYNTQGVYDVIIETTDFCGNINQSTFYNYANIVTNGIDNENSTNQIYLSNNCLYINGSYEGFKIFIFNSLGQLLEEKLVLSNMMTFDNFASGTYIITIYDKQNKIKASLKFIK